MQQSIKILGLLSITAVFMSASCKKLQISTLQNQSGQVLVFGHGGNGFSSIDNPIPENSLKSMEKALENHADGLEMDIQFTADGIPILFHDEILDKTTNGTGRVGDQNWSALRDVQYQSLIPLSREKLISLEEMLTILSAKTDPPYISLDVKFHPPYTSNDFPALTPALIELVNSYAYPERIYIESPSEIFLLQCKDHQPGLNLWLQTRDPEMDIQIAVDNGFLGLVAKNSEISAAQAERLRAAGLRLMTYGIGTKASIVEAVNKQSDAIQVENISRAVNVTEPLNIP